ncbi:MAG: hypothetical protein ACKV2O_06325 [Acidimicrobiales bacterium]
MGAIETLPSASGPSTGEAPQQGWRLDRVSLPAAVESRDAVLVMAFHPRLTVLQTPEIQATAERLAGVFQGPGNGVHVEFTLRDGRSYVLFRPKGARHRLIDIEARQERPVQETLPVLAPLTRPGRSTSGGAGEAVVDQLCRVDQVVLWTAAQRLQAARANVRRELGPETADAPAPPMLAPAPHRAWFRRKPKPLTPSSERGPVDELSMADQYWRLFAGEIEVAAAMAQRARIEAAAGLLIRLGAFAAVGRDPDAGEPPAPAPLEPADVPTAVCALVPENNDAAGPHLVTIPGDAEPDPASMVLEQLSNLGLDRQLIVVTSAETIIEWARLESHVRRASLLQLDRPR